MDLLDKTRQLLAGKKLTEIASATGYSYQWLWKVRDGVITNPSVTRIEKLYAYLTNELSSPSDTN